MAFRLLLTTTLVLLANSAAQLRAQQYGTANGGAGSLLSRLPGGQTSAAFLASSADGLSRYLAPDGPIQPGISAIMGLPMRGGELINRGITQISSRMDNGAQSLSQAAGQNGQIQMPGMEALESSMPASIASLGDSMHSMIRSKNNFIRGQAEAGIQAGNRLGQMMRQGLQGAMSQKMAVRSSGPMEIMSSAQDFMAKSGSTLKEQAKQHFEGTLGRLGSMQGMGEGLRKQAEGIGHTVSSGVQGAVGQLQRTGEQVMSQLQGNHMKNTQAMSGILGSLQDSMGNMGGNMQKNMDGLMRHAQSTSMQLSNSLQEALQAPVKVLSSLTSGLGSMMKGGMGGMGGGHSSGGRY